MVKLSCDDLQTGILQVGKYPAVIAVDFSNGFTDPTSPLGGNFEAVIKANLELMSTAKASKVPIYFTTVEYSSPEQATVFRKRVPDLNMLKSGSHWVEINDSFKEFAKSENIISKHHPSAFFETDLHKKLQSLSVDSLIITGLTTSGCVRATCVDGLQHNYICSILEEGCGDRNEQAHESNLHDMHAKYGQVVSLSETLDTLRSL